jgi:toxin HigB-1
VWSRARRYGVGRRSIRGLGAFIASFGYRRPAQTPPAGDTAPAEMNLPGFDFHALKGFSPTRYTIHVNGPWCITFEFDATDARRVNFEQYH